MHKESSLSLIFRVTSTALIVAVFLVSCNSNDSGRAAVSEVEFNIPPQLRQIQTVPVGSLFADVAVSYQTSNGLVSLPAQTASPSGDSDGLLRTLIAVPAETPFTLQITWYDTAGVERLVLTQLTRQIGGLSPGDVALTFDFSDFDSQAFDFDNDTQTNLAERLANTSPFDSNDPGLVSTANPDGDSDGVSDAVDNCPSESNTNQANLDGDTLGDACDDDIDGDGSLNDVDCAVRDPSVFPGATEISNNGVDNDCDGLIDNVMAITGNGSIPIVLSECGSLPIATVVPSTDITNPLNISPGTLHQGSVFSGRDGTANYYNVALNSGRYLFVVDANDIDGIRNTTVELDRLDVNGEPVEQLIDLFDLDKIRGVREVVITEPTTLPVRIIETENSNTPKDYTLGVFAIGDPVPAPFFVECPTVITVADGVPVTFEFEAGYANEVYLAFDMDQISEYRLDLQFNNIRGAGGVSARVELVDGFGDLGEGETVFSNELLRPNTIDDNFNGSVVFSGRDTGRNWIRFRKRIFGNLNNRYSVVATLTRGNTQ